MRTWRLGYGASIAQWHAERCARRPKAVKLAANDRLREYVQDRLSGVVRGADGQGVGPEGPGWKGRNEPHRGDRRWVHGWSPEQVANRLPVDFPDDGSMRISHEAIYQALSLERADEMNILGLRSEQLAMNRCGQAASLAEIEANCRLCRRRRDVNRLCTARNTNVDARVPQSLGGAPSSVGSRDVEECQPREARLESGVNYCEPERLLLIECAEKHAAACNRRTAERDLGSDAVGT
jgi:hypothetical protein